MKNIKKTIIGLMISLMVITGFAQQTEVVPFIFNNTVTINSNLSATTISGNGSNITGITATQVNAVPTNRLVIINGVTNSLASNAVFIITTGSGSLSNVVINGQTGTLAGGYAILNPLNMGIYTNLNTDLLIVSAVDGYVTDYPSRIGTYSNIHSESSLIYTQISGTSWIEIFGNTGLIYPNPSFNTHGGIENLYEGLNPNDILNVSYYRTFVTNNSLDIVNKVEELRQSSITNISINGTNYSGSNIILPVVFGTNGVNGINGTNGVNGINGTNGVTTLVKTNLTYDQSYTSGNTLVLGTNEVETLFPALIVLTQRGTTNYLSRSNTAYQAITLASNVVFSPDSTFSTNEDTYLSLNVNPLSFSISVDTTQVSYVTWTNIMNNINANVWNTFILHRGYRQTMWGIR